MSKSKVAVLCLVALSMVLASGMTAKAGIIDPCRSYWVLEAEVTPCPLFVCPAGDTDNFVDQGWTISICVLDELGDPIENIPGPDFWMIDCDPDDDLILCGGSASSGADGPTDENGETTMGFLGGLAGGGCVDGMAVVVQGFVVLDSLTDCTTAFCCPINLRSPDIDADNAVTLVDLSLFASGYPPQGYQKCSDMDANGIVNLQDLSRFAFHFRPPGDVCP
jgi:hypothetical protein